MQRGHHSFFYPASRPKQLGYGNLFSLPLTELALNDEAHIISIRINARNGIFDCVAQFRASRGCKEKSGALD
jgi:hypothetical protein